MPCAAVDHGGSRPILDVVRRCHHWLDRVQLTEHHIIAPYVETVEQVLAQDTEQDEQRRIRIIRGVAKDRRVAVEDPEMRHGRKSKSKRFNGYKQHIATDLDTTLILACAVTPANGLTTHSIWSVP